MSVFWISLTTGISGAFLAAICGSVGPLRFAGRAIDYARAGLYLLVVMADGAWKRRERWPECLQRARLER